MSSILIHSLIKDDNIIVKNSSHLQCIELFYPFMNNYKDNPFTIKSIFENYIERPLTTTFRETACFNGRYDNGKRKEPFKVHLYIQFDYVRLNLYYIAKERDFEDAFLYEEVDEFEYKVLVINEKMRKELKVVDKSKIIVLDECDIKRFQ